MHPPAPCYCNDRYDLQQCNLEYHVTDAGCPKCKSDEECEKVGTEWLIQQSRELKKFGVPVLHYYTLGKPKVIWNVVKEII